MTLLIDLYRTGGQSPWLDNLRRDWIEDGQLASLVERGVRGVTSNPTIFAKAISGSTRYDEQFRLLIQTVTPAEAYWELVATDIAGAMNTLLHVFQSSNGVDGYVSVEVAPSLAHDAAGTITAARELRARIAGPNLMVKVPGTDAGATDLSSIAGVSSFFVSRVDSAIDALLSAVNSEEARAARGKAAVAQAQVVYQHFLAAFSGPRWERLKAAGAQVQRPLWASTSTKDPSYPDLLYVDSLIGPATVNTLPDATLEAFADHGTVARTIDADPTLAEQQLAHLSQFGISLADVAATLEREGLASFSQSFDDLLVELEAKAASL